MKRHSPQIAIVVISLLILLLTYIFHLQPMLGTSSPTKNNQNNPAINISDTNPKFDDDTKPPIDWTFAKKIFDSVKKPFIILDKHGFISSLITLVVGFIGGCYQNEIRVFFYSIFLYRRKIKDYKGRIETDRYYNRIGLPFPECPECPKELKMGAAYINLSFANDKNHTKDEYLPSRQIIEQHKYLMITGSPGSGKSTLCKNIVYLYGTNSITDKIPIFIDLGEKGDVNLTKNTIEEIVIESVKKHLEIRSLNLLIEKKLKKGDFRIMFDSFDEVSTDDVKAINKGICKFIQKYKKCSYIITCRKSVSYYFDKQKCTENIKTYEIKDLRIQDIENYAKEWKKQGSSLDVNAFLHHLEERSKIRELAKEPYMVALCIYLYLVDGSLPCSRTTFYDNLSKYLLNKNELENSDININHLSRIAWEIQQIYDNTKNKDSHRITSNDVETLIGANCKEVLEKLEKSSLLQKSPKAKDGPTYFVFPVKSPREYYVAYYIKYLHKCKNEEERREMLLKKYKGHPESYLEIVKFYCGMCKEENDNISELLEELHNYDLENKSIVALEALSESQNVNNIADTILDYYFNLEPSIWIRMDISKKLGAIVSNISEKDDHKLMGEKVYSRLEKSFEKIYPVRIKHPLEYQNITSALASSFTEKASELLLNRYQEEDDVIYNALVDMGNVSVEYLGKFAEGGDTKAVDCLVKIRTDKAINELIRIIFSKNENESITKIAWSLAQTEYITKMNSINNLLDIDNLDEGKNTINYAWSPFGTQRESMNRISYLLLNTPISTNIPTNVVIDNRLLIPLQIEITKNNSKQNKITEIGYIKYIKRKHVNESIKKIDDVLQNLSYHKTMNYNDWCKEWQYIKDRNSIGEFIFSKKDLYRFLIPIVFAGIFSLMHSLVEKNISLIILSLCITIAFIFGILHVDKETYLDNKLMNYLGLKSKLELFYLPLIISIYLFTSSQFFSLDKGIGLLCMDFLILCAITVFIFARYEKWNSNSIFSKLLGDLNIKF